MKQIYNVLFFNEKYYADYFKKNLLTLAILNASRYITDNYFGSRNVIQSTEILSAFLGILLSQPTKIFKNNIQNKPNL